MPPKTGKDGKPLRPRAKAIKDIFDRYDLDGSSTVNSSEELSQMTINALCSIEFDVLPAEVQEQVSAVTADITENPWGIDQFTKWLFSTFAFSTEYAEEEAAVAEEANGQRREERLLQANGKEETQQADSLFRTMCVCFSPRNGRASSVMLQTLPAVLAVNIWVYVLVLLDKEFDYHDMRSFDSSGLREVGVLVSLLLVHFFSHINSFFWECRTAIGSCSALAKSCTRKLIAIQAASGKKELAVVETVVRTTARRCVLFYTALRLQLEKANEEDTAHELEPFLELEEVEEKTRVAPLDVLGWISQDVGMLVHEGCAAPPLAGSVESDLSALNDAYHTCMKLVSTPIPMPFHNLVTLGVTIFAFAIPIPFIATWGWYIGIPATLASLFFFGVTFLGQHLFSSALSTVEGRAPLIDMVTIGLQTEEAVWAYVRSAKKFDPEARKSYIQKHALKALLK